MDSTDTEITELKAHLAATRERRIAAQKEAAALPRLRCSLTRVERDASSGTTTQVEALGQQIGQLREEITVSAHSIDNIRVWVHGLAPGTRPPPATTGSPGRSPPKLSSGARCGRTRVYRIG